MNFTLSEASDQTSPTSHNQSIRRQFAAGVLLSTTLLLGSIEPASADTPTPEPSSDAEPSPGPVLIELVPGNDVDAPIEALAVDDYVSSDPLLTDESDVVVATVPFDTDAGTADLVVVAPADEVDVASITTTLDPEGGQVTVGGETEVSSDQPLTSGAGMGSWPSWGSRPQYQVLIKAYLNNNYIGYARFSTKYRSRNFASGPDQWQIARSAYAQTDECETAGPDSGTHVKQLWISNKLTPETQSRAKQWDDDITSPINSGRSCENLASVYGVGITNCAETDVFQSSTNVGHMRVSSDQGTVTTGGSRALEYTGGFRVRRGKSILSTFYQFATFRVGNDFYAGKMYGGTKVKCAAEFAGSTSAPVAQGCAKAN